MPLPQPTGVSPDTAPGALVVTVAQPPPPVYPSCPPGTTRVGNACLPALAGIAPGPKPSVVGYAAPPAVDISTVGYAPYTPPGVTTTDQGREFALPPFPWGGLVLGLAAVFFLGRR